jgi:LPS-assembly lipoprotein
MYRTGLLILTLSLLPGLSACGFRLAGTVDLPDQLSSIYLTDEGFDESQRQTLRRSLVQAGASLLAQPDAEAANLSVNLKRLPDRQMATGADTGANVKRITRQLDYSVKSAAGEIIVPMRTLTQQRDVSLDDDNLLSSDREKDAVARDLEKALFDQLIRQLTLI